MVRLPGKFLEKSIYPEKMLFSPWRFKFRRNAIENNPSNRDPPEESEIDTLMIGISSIPYCFLQLLPHILIERVRKIFERSKEVCTNIKSVGT